jgi:hypothetical protein
MIKAVAKFIIVLMLATGSSSILARTPVEKSKNAVFARAFVNLSALYDLCTDQAESLLKAENEPKLLQINKQIKSLFHLENFDIRPFFKIVKDIEELEFFKFSGPLYFAINSEYETFVKVEAQIKPVEFYQYIFKLLEGPEELKAFKKSPESVEIRIPVDNFTLVVKIHSDGLKLYSDKNEKLFKKLLPIKSEKLLSFELDFNTVKELLAKRYVAQQQAVCLGNLIKINNALSMYLLSSGSSMDKLDLRLLENKEFIGTLPICPAGGVYSLDANNKNLSVCSVHGSVKNLKIVNQNLKLLVDPRLESFKTFRFLIKNNSIIFKIAFNKKAALQQWLAIFRQQILTLKYMVLNKLSDATDEQKASMVDMIEAIKCEIVKGQLQIRLDRIDETLLATSIIAASGSLAQSLIPRYRRRLKFARAGKCAANRRMLKMAVEMFVSENPKENVTLGALKNMDYLKDFPKCPEGGEYEIIDDNKVKCSLHGF